MKILLDENIPPEYYDELKGLGHDALYINNGKKRTSDKEIYSMAVNEKRCIVSKDSDFDEFRKEEHFGIIKIDHLVNNAVGKLLYFLKQYKGRQSEISLKLSKDYYYEYNKKHTKKGEFKQLHKIKKEYNKELTVK